VAYFFGHTVYYGCILTEYLLSNRIFHVVLHLLCIVCFMCFVCFICLFVFCYIFGAFVASVVINNSNNNNYYCCSNIDCLISCVCSD